MAAELITPRDEISHLPLPIVQNEMLPDDDPNVANMHHGEHPNSAPELQTLGGRAVRSCQIQLVRSTDHNIGNKAKGKLTYHDFYKGPALTLNEHEQFWECVFGCAGFSHSRGILLGDGEPVVVDLTPHQSRLLRIPAQPKPVKRHDIERLRHKALTAYDDLIDPRLDRDDYLQRTIKEFRQKRAVQAGFTYHHISYRYEPIRDFFRAYALKQDLSHVKDSTIDEFLHTPNADKKNFLGHWLLSQALAKAAEPVLDAYTLAHVTGRLHPSMPKKPWVLMRYKLGQQDHRNELTARLESTLRTKHNLAA